MKRRIMAFTLLAVTLSLLYVPNALAEIPADEPISREDFVIRVGTTDFDMLTNDIDVAILSSGKKLVYKKDNSRNGLDYQVKTKEATFYIPNRDATFAYAAELTKKGKTARGIKIGSKLSDLLRAYPKTDDIWDDGKVTYYYYQVPNAPSKLPAAVAAKLDSELPVYFFKLIISVSNKTKKVTGIRINQWYLD